MSQELYVKGFKSAVNYTLQMRKLSYKEGTIFPNS